MRLKADRPAVILVSCQVLIWLQPCLCQGGDNTQSRGARPLDITEATGYRQTWALVIGIDYKGGITDSGGALQLPQLNNAVSDAKLFANALTTYYSDKATRFGYFDDEHLRVLLEADATEENILEEVARLCDDNIVKPEDSILIYYAGHAVRLDETSRSQGDAVAILPRNAKLSAGGEAIVNTIGLPYGLVSRLKASPARHKLLILDCCYSGEVFELPPDAVKDGIVFKGRVSEASIRSDTALQIEPAFQAIASCRRTQTASDGSSANSPFTEALVDGLKRLPAGQSDDSRVWANLLLSYMRPNPQFADAQRPDCRNLIHTDGEFCFYPAPSASFAEFTVSTSEQTLLQASIASRQGGWWFEEMPWFIPGVRASILNAQSKNRSGNFARMIEPKEIRKLTEEYLQAGGQRDELAKMRATQVKALFTSQSASDLEKSLKVIRQQFAAYYGPLKDDSEVGVVPSDRTPIALEAADVHLIAVVLHALREEELAIATYRDAISRYSKEAVEQERPLLHILRALCQADLGELLLTQGNSPEEAAKQFQVSLDTMRNIVGATNKKPGSLNHSSFFEIYALCREADAWINLNQWRKANSCLLNALDTAKSVDRNHYLTAHVQRRRAWAEIIQWRLEEAEKSFGESNAILERLMQENSDIQSNESIRFATFGSSEKESLIGIADLAIGDVPRDLAKGREAFEFPQGFETSADFSSKIAYLHNLHGVAMARRFKGNAIEAAECYRDLVGMVEETYADFGERDVDSTINSQFLSRIINTQERLGDCNLFAPPKDRDLKEALDDYRRAMHRVHLIHDKRERDRWTAILLYKQALSLSLPSPFQDTDLALQMCCKADRIYASQADSSTGLYRSLGLLATPLVEFLNSSSLSADSRQVDMSKYEATLRNRLIEFRSLVGPHPHRDELEISLLASKVLLEELSGRHRHQTLEDADLLQSFCRIALVPYRSLSMGKAASGGDASDSRQYLRQYYDAIMAAKLHIERANVRELLEIQREATNGSYFVKNRNSLPVLALYILENECILLMDIPGGDSKAISLADTYQLCRIKEACYGQRLPLPREVERALQNWWATQSCGREELEVWEQKFCWWETPVGNPIGLVHLAPTETPRRTHVGKAIVGHFPFELGGFSTALSGSSP